MGKSESINFKAEFSMGEEENSLEGSKDTQEQRYKRWEERKQPSLEKTVKEAVHSGESPVYVK